VKLLIQAGSLIHAGGSRSLVLMQVTFLNISTPGIHLVPAYQVLQYDAVK